MGQLAEMIPVNDQIKGDSIDLKQSYFIYLFIFTLPSEYKLWIVKTKKKSRIHTKITTEKWFKIVGAKMHQRYISSVMSRNGLILLNCDYCDGN